VTDTTLDGRLGLATPREKVVRTLSVGDVGSADPCPSVREAEAMEAVLTVRPYFCLTVFEAELPGSIGVRCSPDAEIEATAA